MKADPTGIPDEPDEPLQQIVEKIAAPTDQNKAMARLRDRFGLAPLVTPVTGSRNRRR